MPATMASTRCCAGHTGPDAAGKVIEAFGHWWAAISRSIILLVILTIINFINIIGGLIVGGPSTTRDERFGPLTLLTIGEGLMAQIGAGDLDRCWRGGSRVSTDQDIGQQMISQLFSNPSVMFLTAGIIGIMGLIPNMPHIAFLTLAGGLAWAAGR